VETTPHILEEAIVAYKDVAQFKVGMQHLYVKSKRDIAWQEFSTSYRLIVEDVHSIITDWEDDWKNPTDKLGPLEEDEDPDKSEEELEQMNGACNHHGQSTFPNEALKRKDKGPEHIGGMHKKAKEQ